MEFRGSRRDHLATGSILKVVVTIYWEACIPRDVYKLVPKVKIDLRTVWMFVNFEAPSTK
jgi:hypothetical protein